MRLWPRKHKHEALPPPPPPPPATRKGPKAGDDLRKAFLEKLEARSDEQE